MIKRLLVIASLAVIAIVAIFKSEVLGALATSLLVMACIWLGMVLVMGVIGISGLYGK